MFYKQAICGAALIVAFSAALAAQEPIKLASGPALSSDGSRLAFAWRGDIWLVSSAGGTAHQVTTSPATDSSPVFSPSDDALAFISDRAGTNQLFLVDLSGGVPRQLTFHSEGCQAACWFPDGESLLITASRDHYWGRHSTRFFQIAARPRSTEHLLFDAYGQEAQLSSDGERLLFTREGARWWRKGYRGSRASQIWEYALETCEFQQLVKRETESRTPLWQVDGKGFYFVSGQSGSMNLWHRDLTTGTDRQLTEFKDDSVIKPSISRDGRMIAFRHLFDLYCLRTDEDGPAKKLAIYPSGDSRENSTRRRTLTSATSVAFSDDGLEVAFIAGGDLWVMDTELREPRQLTNTPEEERSPQFSPAGDAILFVSDMEGQSDIWKATRADEDQFWWQNDRFRLERLTQDAEVESDLLWSPAGDLVAFIRGSGNLWVMQPDGKVAKRLLRTWDAPEYDWSPDGKWIVYAVDDADFNRDVYVLPSDGSGQPVNISRHPDNDYRPKWSPDGKIIALTGRRVGNEVDINFIYLRADEDQRGARDRKLERAIEKIKKARKEKKAPDNKDPKGGDKPKAAEKKDPENQPDETQVVIDFEDIHLRLRRVSIPGANETQLFWSHDSKKLAFTATIDGKQGIYTISPPDELEPKLLSTTTGTQARWISQGNQILLLAGGKPASMSSSGAISSYSFTVRQELDLAARYQAGFDQCWRTMRDFFYDGALNNRNWDAIRRKYVPLAKASVDNQTFSRVVHLMLGELNGSHLGFFARSGANRRDQDDWQETTAHLGLRFDPRYKGPGLKVRDVIPNGPADKVRTRVQVGEVVVSINGKGVDPDVELTSRLNGILQRDIRLRVRDSEDEEREVTLRPISYSAARELLYEKWVRDNQRSVAEASQGKFGYLHIRGMNMSSFYRFERELYAVAAGKDGILIDVRENGGGFTTDHLLTVLTQPRHAITVPRGGTAGYPQDRSVYATWRKPLVVLCNQNSFSNAEIFSHAIKTLKRGQLVGVPTAGGVISTGRRRIMDLGFLRLPFRGWYVLGTGEDMELNGAVPHHIVWPAPGELPAGKDRQLEKAVEVLADEVQEWKKRPQPTLRKASER